ncbi:CMRF35-like molecule 5 [Pithys albifrons albifrons]|uniref:CMRF35-like molecule 5 n=1 Tax=Pithys albifrons albifrons TaxID=3385563 RepID=UPI003A5CD0CD
MTNQGEKSTVGARSWKMRIFLVWTLFPGGWAVTGPKQVTADQGSSLAVSCSYKPGYEKNSKYWCRQNSLGVCFTFIIQTSGSEVTVTQGRVSIKDNHTAHSFTVTLRDVMPGDAGLYSCGVKRKLWFNRSHTTRVVVSAAVSTTTEGSDVGPLTRNTLCPRGSGEPPVLSQLGVTPLLLLFSLKVLIALALLCVAAWMRNWCRSCSRENKQLFEATGSTRALGCPPFPTTSEPQGRSAVPSPPTLPGPCCPSHRPRAGRCLAPGDPLPVKPPPILAVPVLERGGFGVQRACVCGARAAN